MPDLPTGASIRIVLTYPRGAPAAAARALELAGVLRADGFGVGDPFPVSSRAAPKQGISYYFAQDENAAAEIGRHLSGVYGEAKLISLSRNSGLPRPGTIEIATGAN